MSDEDEIKLVDSDSIVEQHSSLENKLSSLFIKLDQKNEQKLEQIDCTDLKKKHNAIITFLVTKNFSIIKKHLQSKSSPHLILIQQTCVREMSLQFVLTYLKLQIATHPYQLHLCSHWLRPRLQPGLFVHSTAVRRGQQLALFHNRQNPPFFRPHFEQNIKAVGVRRRGPEPPSLTNSDSLFQMSVHVHLIRNFFP